MDDAERMEVGNGSKELLHDNGSLRFLVLLTLDDALKQLTTSNTTKNAI